MRYSLYRHSDFHNRNGGFVHVFVAQLRPSSAHQQRRPSLFAQRPASVEPAQEYAGEFQTAVITNDINAIALARDKAEDFHDIALDIAPLDGKKAISQTIVSQFDEYFKLAEGSASAMLESNTGAAPAQLEQMIVALKKIETTLQQEYRTAVGLFSKSLDESRAVTQQILWINLASIFCCNRPGLHFPTVDFLDHEKFGTS